MSASQLIVTVAGIGLIAGLARFFFRPPESATASEAGGVQEARVVVRGGYTPAVVQARTGTPLRLTFDRQEDGDCSARVVFPELAMSRFLAPFEQTVVEFTPARPGRFAFSCGMNMLHGALVVEGDPVEAPAGTPGGLGAGEELAGDGEDAETAARRAEVADLTHRVVLGALLTLPIVVAVMATDVFSATFVPDVLMNRGVQLALIAPVMFWVGWPVAEGGQRAQRDEAVHVGGPVRQGEPAAAMHAPGLGRCRAGDVRFHHRQGPSRTTPR